YPRPRQLLKLAPNEGRNLLDRRTIAIAGAEIELHEGGDGPPLLFLHGLEGFAPQPDYVARLARARRLVAPSHPGFGRSSLPDWLDHVADIAHLYLGLLDRLELARFDLVGCSLGGWIAAELACMIPERLHRVRMPTLFLRGAADGVVSAEYLAGYAHLVPGAETDVIAGAGHLPHLEQPAAFATRLLEFLEAGS